VPRSVPAATAYRSHVAFDEGALAPSSSRLRVAFDEGVPAASSSPSCLAFDEVCQRHQHPLFGSRS